MGTLINSISETLMHLCLVMNTPNKAILLKTQVLYKRAQMIHKKIYMWIQVSLVMPGTKNNR